MLQLKNKNREEMLPFPWSLAAINPSLGTSNTRFQVKTTIINLFTNNWGLGF